MAIEFTTFLISLIIASILLMIIIVILLIPRKDIGKTVDEMVRQKKPLDQILAQTKMKKLDEKEVLMYFLFYTVQDYLRQGYNKEEIESMALDNDWPQEMIKVVFSKLG